MSIVRFKGNRNGVQLLLAEDASFADLLAEIEVKLQSSKDFFTNGLAVAVAWGNQEFTQKQSEQIEVLLDGYGLKWDKSIVVAESEPVKRKPAPAEIQQPRRIELDGYEAPALVINKTLRSGTRIIYDGIVILFGDMNPGSEVIAGRDIIIHGSCRGLVHAGAFGARDARIIANKLKPVQIRIADVIARAPDGGEWPEQGGIADVAYIDNGALTIKPMGKH